MSFRFRKDAQINFDIQKPEEVRMKYFIAYIFSIYSMYYWFIFKM